MVVKVDARDFARAGQRLRGADTAVRREFSRAIREVAKPYGQYVLVAGAKRLPSRGGLAYRVASGRVSVQASSMRVSVTLRTREGDALRGIDQGKLRHPVWARKGKPRRWVDQNVPAGVFTEAFEANADQVRTAVLAAGQRVLNQLTDRTS